MGHTAFDATCIVNESPLKIESIALWESRLLVGGHDGSFRIYTAPGDLFEKEEGDGVEDLNNTGASSSTPVASSLANWSSAWAGFPTVGGKNANNGTASSWTFAGGGGGQSNTWAAWGGTSVFASAPKAAGDQDGMAQDIAENKYVLRETKTGVFKRAIIQMDVIAKKNLVIVLSDVLSLHALPSLQSLSTLAKTRGGTLYAWDEPRGMLCVARQRKLHVYRFHGMGKDFIEVKELVAPDLVKAMAWSGESLCLGVGKDYKIINTTTGVLTEVFPAGRSALPLVVPLTNGELLLGKDNIGVFVDSQGRPSRPGGISWSETPLNVVALLPYALARLPRFIEVRSLRPPYALVQTLPVKGMNMLVSAPRGFVTASDSQVFHLLPVSLAEQAQQLAAAGKYEDALAICKLLPPEEADGCPEKEDNIRIRFGRSLFDQGKYDLAMEQFRQSTSLSLPAVLGLFPTLVLPPLAGFPPTGPLSSLLTAGADAASEWPPEDPPGTPSTPSPSTPRAEVSEGPPVPNVRAMSALVPYLNAKRPKIARQAEIQSSSEDGDSHGGSGSGGSRSEESEGGEGQGGDDEGGGTEGEGGAAKAGEVALSPRDLAVLLDTVGLQAMVVTGAKASSRRLLEGRNWCDVPTLEGLLLKWGKMDELVALYKSHGLHHKALELLLRAVQDPGSFPKVAELSADASTDALITYMKELPPGDSRNTLVLEFCPWLLRTHPQRALELLASLDPPLPSGVVLQLLKDHAPALQTAYLERMLDHPGAAGGAGGVGAGAGAKGGGPASPLEATSSTGLQDELVHLYMERVLEEYRQAGGSWDEVRQSDSRAKLLHLLRRAGAYSAPEALVRMLPRTALMEERALLLGRIGMHRPALAIFARKLHNPILALAYCDGALADEAKAAPPKPRMLPSLDFFASGAAPPPSASGKGRPGGPGTAGSNYMDLLTIYLEPSFGVSEFVKAIRLAPPPPSSPSPASSPKLSPTDEKRGVVGGPRIGGGAKVAHISDESEAAAAAAAAANQIRSLGAAKQGGGPGGGAEVEQAEVAAALTGIEKAVMVPEALDLLARRWSHINGGRAVAMMPEETALAVLMPFFAPLLRRESEAMRNAAVVKNLCRSENLQVREALVKGKSRFVRITPDRTCSICRKRIGLSAFAVSPSNAISHFVCFRDSQKANQSPRSQAPLAPPALAGP